MRNKHTYNAHKTHTQYAHKHTHILTPITPTTNTHTAVVTTPLAVRKAALHSTRQLLSRMQLAGYSSAILHPLLRVLDGPAEELRKDTLETILSLSVALGSDFAIFVATIRKVCGLWGCGGVDVGVLACGCVGMWVWGAYVDVHVGG